MVDTTKYLRKCHNPQTEHTIKRILEDLSKYRVAMTDNFSAARYLAQYFKEQKDSQWIFFSWNSVWKKSVIHIPPSIRLELDGRRIKLLFNQDIGEKKK